MAAAGRNKKARTRDRCGARRVGAAGSCHSYRSYGKTAGGAGLCRERAWTAVCSGPASRARADSGAYVWEQTGEEVVVTVVAAAARALQAAASPASGGRVEAATFSIQATPFRGLAPPTRHSGRPSHPILDCDARRRLHWRFADG